MKCSDCTHVFASKHIIETEDSFTTNKVRARYYLDAISTMTLHSMMDIGTPADFYFLKEAHKQFPLAKKIALDFYKKAHPDYVEMRKSFPDLPLDLCTAFHVLEHVESPHHFIASILSGSKHFILEVPNCESEDSMLTSSTKPHTHFFNMESLRTLFKVQKERTDSVRFLTIEPGGYGKRQPRKRSCIIALSLPDGIFIESRTSHFNLFKFLQKQRVSPSSKR